MPKQHHAQGLAAMRAPDPIRRLPANWFGKGLLRAVILLAAAAAIAALAGAFGIAHDYGYLRASILTGSPGGSYHALATQLADRAMRGHGRLTVVATAGSIENVRRLSRPDARCAEKFAFIQDGTPVPSDSGIELLGRIPKPEALLLLGRQGNALQTFADLRGGSIGIGPEGSGTAYLIEQLFAGPDLQALGVRLSNHELIEQARLVSEGKLDLAAFVMDEDGELIRRIIVKYGLDIVSPRDLDGLVARYPWLSLGVIPEGRYDLVHAIPAAERKVAHLATFVVANDCAKRADRVALLILLGAELPGFVRGNPPSATSPVTKLPLAAAAHQFFQTGEPEIADRYFPWLVNLMSPAYWVYLVMAVTVLFNGMNIYSRFRLWRLDAAREKLEGEIKTLVDPEATTHAQIRAQPAERVMAAPERRAAAASIMTRLRELRERCRRQANSIFAPMGNEMFYRYQQALIDQATTTLAALLQGAPGQPGAQAKTPHSGVSSDGLRD
jgi:TRAP-type uncharacterized transport system substrate-binding protein